MWQERSHAEKAAPSYSQNTSGKTKTTSSQNPQGKVSVSGEGGVFIKGYVNEIELQLLVDSGATLSLLSNRAFNRIHGNGSSDMLQKVNAPVLRLLLKSKMPYTTRWPLLRICQLMQYWG
jgi:predicted aspartyl protease